MNVSRTAQATMLAALGAALTAGCSSQSGPLLSVCPLPTEAPAMLVYPKSGAKVTPADIGIILYGGVGTGSRPITVVGTHADIDTLPTSLPSPLPSPTATPPAGQKSWGPIHAVGIRPLLPPGEYDVDATITHYSCPPGTQHRVQVKIGNFKLI